MLLTLTSYWRNSQVGGDLNSYDARYIKILTCKIVVSSAHLWGPIITHSGFPKSLQWRHNERDGGSNHRLLDCLINRLISRRSKKASKLRVGGLCEGIPPVTSRFPSQRASNAENVSIWWRHHDSPHGYSWKQDMDYSWVYTSVRCYVQYRVKFDRDILSQDSIIVNTTNNTEVPQFLSNLGEHNLIIYVASSALTGLEILDCFIVLGWRVTVGL